MRGRRIVVVGQSSVQLQAGSDPTMRGRRPVDLNDSAVWYSAFRPDYEGTATIALRANITLRTAQF